MAGRPNAEKFVEFQTGTPMCLADTTQSTFMISGSSAAPGLVPAPPTVAGAVLFLREDGTWAQATPGTASVTNNMLATMADATFKGRAAGAGAGTPQDLTASEATAILNIFVSASAGQKGLVPAPTTSDVGKVLAADGWQPGVVRLAALSISGATTSISINLSSYTAYPNLFIQLWGMLPLTNGDPLYARFSATGVTYDNSGYSYVFQYFSPATGVLSIRGSVSSTSIETAFIIGASASVGGYNGVIEMNGYRETTIWPRITFRSYWYDSSGPPNNITNVGGAGRNRPQPILGIQFFCSTSGLANGKIYIYGHG